MKFSFEPRHMRQDATSDRPTFRVARLWADAASDAAEVSHLIDRTYDYASARELRWHLAERFARPPATVTVDRI
ncbi:MAG TPA: hypothetical protein VEA41_17620 [Salinarimonas sp.]|nr:hypothetical protein [Salinarimonas sp.]